MIRFAHPLYLHLLWLAPLLLGLAYFEYRWRLSAMKRWASEALWDSALPGSAPLNILIKRAVWVAVICLLALAAAGPQVGTRLTQVTREGVDLAIALDLSASMLTEDVTPNRLDKARHEIQRLLERLRGDRVALVPFAGVAFVQVPLTLDYSAVNGLLNSLEPGMIPVPGTAIGDAIKQARRAFRPEGKAQKILILITDGEDHETDAISQAKEAAKEGVVIFTVGMATDMGGPIPVKDEQGRVTGYKQEGGSGTVVSKLNEDLLKQIADATGGQYFRDVPSGDEFRKIFDRLNGMDKQKFEQKQFIDYEDRFQWPVAVAFLLLVIEEFIPGYRRKKVENGKSI
jgi:Ca-activated chloride channel family protein